MAQGGAAPPADEDMTRSDATKSWTRNENAGPRFYETADTNKDGRHVFFLPRPKSPRVVMSFGGGVSKSTTTSPSVPSANTEGADVFGELSRCPSFVSDHCHGDVNKHG